MTSAINKPKLDEMHILEKMKTWNKINKMILFLVLLFFVLYFLASQFKRFFSHSKCQTEQPNWILPIQSQIKSFRHNVCVRCICKAVGFLPRKYIGQFVLYLLVLVLLFHCIYRIILQQQLPNFQKETNKGRHHLTPPYYLRTLKRGFIIFSALGDFQSI